MIIHERYLFNKFIKTTTIDALYYLVIYLYISFFSPYLSTLGWTESLKGLFFSTFAMVGILAAPLLGILSDKIGRFKVIIIGIVLEILSLTGYVFITGTVELFLLRVVSAVAFNAVIVSALARINDVVESDGTRTKTTGLFQSIISITVILAPLLGGFVADNYGYQTLFIVALGTMTTILLGLLVFDVFFYNDDHPHKKRDKVHLSDFNLISRMKQFFSIKELRVMGLVGFFANLTVPFGILLLPAIIMGKMGLDNTHLSVALFLMGFAYVFQYFFGSWVDKIGKGRGVLLGASLLGIFTSLLFFAPSYEVLLGLILLRSFGNSLFNVSAWSYMSDVGEKYKIEGQVVGSYSSISRIAISLSFILTGFLLTFLSKEIFLIYGFLIVLPLPFVTVFLLKRVKPETWEK